MATRRLTTRFLAIPIPIAVIAAAALSLGGCGEDEAERGGGSAVTTATMTATAPAPPAALDQALWPAPADARPATAPRAVARSFVEDFVGVDNPAIGAFQEGEPRAGEVPVMRRGENGRATDRVIATVVVRQLDGERWFVTGALSDEIEVTRPEVRSEISSPVTIAGTGVGHEGNIVLRVHTAFDPQPLGLDPVTAGAMQQEPFSAQLAFRRPADANADTGAIVARAVQPVAGSDAFVAFAVRFAARP